MINKKYQNLYYKLDCIFIIIYHAVSLSQQRSPSLGKGARSLVDFIKENPTSSYPRSGQNLAD
jgi:hypothetical protein